MSEPVEIDGVIVSDPAHYRKLCEPFASTEAAGEAVDAFFKEVRALRDKHKIPDVYVMLEVTCLVPDPATPSPADRKPLSPGGESGPIPVLEMRASACSQMGDNLRTLSMLANFLGQERRNLDEAIKELSQADTAPAPTVFTLKAAMERATVELKRAELARQRALDAVNVVDAMRLAESVQKAANPSPTAGVTPDETPEAVRQRAETAHHAAAVKLRDAGDVNVGHGGAD